MRHPWPVRCLLLVLALWLLVLPVRADGPSGNTVFGGEYDLKAGERLQDNLVVYGGKVHLEHGSTVTGEVSVTGGDVLLEGTVGGDVVVFGGNVTLGPGAVVEGDLVTLVAVRRTADAQVKGSIVQGIDATKSLKNLPGLLSGHAAGVGVHPPAMIASAQWSKAFGFLRSLGIVVAMLVVAALTVMIVPGPLQRVGDLMARSWLLSLGIGASTLIVLAVLLPILAIIIIGIPIVFVLGIAAVLCALLGWVAAGQIVGRKILRVLKAGPSSPMREALVGIALMTLVAMAPCAGPLLVFLVVSWGLGAVILTRLGTIPYPGLVRTSAAGSTDPAAPAGVAPEGQDQAIGGPAGGAKPTETPGTPPASGGGQHRGDTHRLPDQDLDPWSLK